MNKTTTSRENVLLPFSPGMSSPVVRGFFFFLFLCLCGYANTREEYRNVALNPDDVHESEWTEADGYPHATSNSEYPDFDDVHWKGFQARCAINGLVDNSGHGLGKPSWGPNNVENYMEDLYWRVDLGEPMEVDKVVIYIRADFPHDDYWHSATLKFSDGSSEAISLEKTADPQTFPFTPRVTDYLIITDLVEELPREWCSFTEVQLWGMEPQTPVIRGAATGREHGVTPGPNTLLLPFENRTNPRGVLVNGRIVGAATGTVSNITLFVSREKL